MTSLSGNLVVSKDRHPDRVALHCDDLRITFAEFDAAAGRVATLLDRAGIEPGDRVGLMLPNTPAFAIAKHRTVNQKRRLPAGLDRRAAMDTLLLLE